MPYIPGPCERCGEPVTRYVKPGRRRYHIECAIAVQTEHNLAMADGTNPLLEKATEYGNTVGAQIKARSGPYYDKWAQSMAAYINAPESTKSPDSDNIPAKPAAKPRRKHTRE